ncbi:hypothetical protein HDV03_002080 [Kappamyces sp. JEL0829]|nr:hypothetical protein HDV03_002080 [Kappamyces sp. JEL0829]
MENETHAWILQLLQDAFAAEEDVEFLGVVGDAQPTGPTAQWSLHSSKNGLEIYTSPPDPNGKDAAGKIYKAKGLITCPDISPETFAKTVQGYNPTTSLWDKTIRDGRVLSSLPVADGEAELVYLCYKLPPLFDREFITLERRKSVAIRLKEDGKAKEEQVFVIAVRSVDDDNQLGVSVPEVPASFFRVRGTVFTSGWVIRAVPDGCQVRYLAQCDPKGWIPAFVVNWFANEQPLAALGVYEYLRPSL